MAPRPSEWKSTIAAVAAIVFLVLGVLEPQLARYGLVPLVCWGASGALFFAGFMTCGVAVQGRAWGVLIDERNRFSTSRLQMAAWGVMLLSLLSTYAGLRGAYLPAEGLLEFNFPAHLWALAGISVGTAVASPFLLRSVALRGEVVTKNAAPTHARLTDLFQGEVAGTTRTIDISRFQLLALTGVAVFTYAAAIWQVLMPISADAGADALKAALSNAPSMPDHLVQIIAVSHVGYLVAKQAPSLTPPGATTSPPSSPPSPDQPGHPDRWDDGHARHGDPLGGGGADAR